MKKEEKQKKAQDLHAELSKAKTVLLSAFEGLTVAQDTDLRTRIAKAGGKHQVFKNTLIERAAEGTAVEPVAKKLRGTTSLTYTESDPVTLAKVITAYAKEHPALVFKTGVVEGRVVSIADLVGLSNLPSKEALFAKVLFLINSPAQRVASCAAAVARNLAYVIQQGVEQNKFKDAAAG